MCPRYLELGLAPLNDGLSEDLLCRQKAHRPALEARVTHVKKNLKGQFNIELYDFLGQRLTHEGANWESAGLQHDSERFGGRPEARCFFPARLEAPGGYGLCSPLSAWCEVSAQLQFVEWRHFGC